MDGELTRGSAEGGLALNQQGSYHAHVRCKTSIIVSSERRDMLQVEHGVMI